MCYTCRQTASRDRSQDILHFLLDTTHIQRGILHDIGVHQRSDAASIYACMYVSNAHAYCIYTCTSTYIHGVSIPLICVSYVRIICENVSMNGLSFVCLCMPAKKRVITRVHIGSYTCAYKVDTWHLALPPYVMIPSMIDSVEGFVQNWNLSTVAPAIWNCRSTYMKSYVRSKLCESVCCALSHR